VVERSDTTGKGPILDFDPGRIAETSGWRGSELITIPNRFGCDPSGIFEIVCSVPVVSLRSTTG